MHIFAPLFAVMLLLEPDEPRRVEVPDFDEHVEKVKEARIVSRESIADREFHVCYYEGDVVVTYGDECQLNCGRLYVFLSSSNRFSRVVAVGNVALTNGSQICSGDYAVFRKKTNVIELFGRPETLARFRDGTSEIAGTHILYAIDTEEAKVIDSEIEFERPKEMKLK